jgi:hypothetical protein
MHVALFKGLLEAIPDVMISTNELKMKILSVKTSFSPNKLKSFRNSKISVRSNNFISYRGYYSRKYEHDFYARKNYLSHVENKVRNIFLKRRSDLNYGRLNLLNFVVFCRTKKSAASWTTTTEDLFKTNINVKNSTPARSFQN